MKCKSYNQFFETIANKTRLKIIESLFKSPKFVGEICEDIKEEQSKVSHNLRVLLKCHLIKKKKEGKKRIYSLNEKTMVPIMKIVDEHVIKYCDRRCWVNK